MDFLTPKPSPVSYDMVIPKDPESDRVTQLPTEFTNAVAFFFLFFSN